MSLGSWDPGTEQSKADFNLDRTVLEQFAGISQQEQLDQLEQLLDARQQQLFAEYMQQDKTSWEAVAEDISNEDIEHLMRFFTVAEKLPGWEAGANSPVIWLGKILKQRGIGISKDLVLWIKDHSNNRFLPHGPLL